MSELPFPGRRPRARRTLDLELGCVTSSTDRTGAVRLPRTAMEKL